MSSHELNIAELKCLREVQRQSFLDDIELIGAGQVVPKRSKLFKLCAKIDDDGILRVDSRLNNLDADDSYIKPIILDGRHRYSELLYQKYHNHFNHQNDATVINEVRQRYLVIGARRTLQKIKQQCIECRIRKTSPETQIMGQLPRIRLEYGVHPFTYTGVDYFGPFEVAVGRRREKRYGVLFTCRTCRAVHLEVASSLTTDSFLMAWRRFISRRANPKEMHSDNGTNFRGAESELQRSIKNLDNNIIKSSLAGRHTTWNFIPPGSPHFGGCWERMVRPIKSSLSVTLKNRRPPSDELLHTLLLEAEHVVNSRP